MSTALHCLICFDMLMVSNIKQATILMEPMQQQPQQNPYEFITNPTQPTNNRPLGGSMKTRIIVVIGGFILLLIIFSIISSILSSAGNAAKQSLKDVSAEQVEIIRVSELGMTEALGSQAKGYATSVNLIFITDKAALDERLSAQGIKMNKTELASKLNPKTEELLSAAGSNNRYDESLTEILNDLIANHQKTVQKAFQANEDAENTKSTLEQLFNNTDKLLSPQKSN